ncbi:hypothetical protein OGAPHI_004300 [Ogataea philodendri]|uniref:Major facilitator superfamily (MFS) profile domain-containing protein n=1 Tax=Ogataea philodendri TaxID=1378263 RepID=A0A9P8T5N1_9ASCO|nr:uncharacterized protein OGAPHI_004300 [Ogataea philodendri]KAH3666111.1 hypothetical protein OGAPHI_004300 [Ogataea philodendri]
MSSQGIELDQIGRSSEDKSFDLSFENGNEFTIEDPTEFPKTVEFKGHTLIIENTDIKESVKLRFQTVVISTTFMIMGILDQSLGSVMEYLLEDYHTDRTHLSNLFIFQALGYILASFTNNKLYKQLGLKGLFPLSLVLMGSWSAAFAAKLNLGPLIFFAMVNGIGFGTADCAMNLYVGNLKYSNQLLGTMHAFYGFGCFISPLLCTYLIHQGFSWNQYYIIILALISVELVGALTLFTHETGLKYQYQLKLDREKEGDEDEVTFIQIVKNKYVLFFSTCLFFYLGSELSLGVWLFNYLLRIHEFTDSSSSYVTSAYWIFLTAGRLVLGLVTGHLFDDFETKGMIIYCTLVTIGVCVFWLFNHIPLIMITSICFVGFFVGPMFSVTVVISMKTLPKRLSTAGVAIICGLGAMGATVMPYIMGLIADNTAGGDGAGLVYFPFYELLLFLSANMMWVFFFFRNKRTLELYERLPSD